MRLNEHKGGTKRHENTHTQRRVLIKETNQEVNWNQMGIGNRKTYQRQKQGAETRPERENKLCQNKSLESRSMYYNSITYKNVNEVSTYSKHRNIKIIHESE